MCISGTPSGVHYVDPRHATPAWRSFSADPVTLLLRPASRLGRETDERCWYGRVAKAHARPTGRRDSDLGIHASARPSEGVVVGKVRLFGRVVEHKNSVTGQITGYLAEYAEIVGLSVKHSSAGEAAVRALASAYRVRVLA
jgi:hypothetical protein